ncbi:MULTISPECIES: MGMT family protein [Candidatus Nitrosocaldus]|jgi:methylated-DNA-[protein]-cysteine S-methyltransferase|uniref:methylated-DNA--[protein]-cysteine S-methyltransferase n=1 Tax=Candidatus Nitrosocaldus cavascurensis TaxID=2058097 RepID=A0A2K5AST9_9ARCH|nr:MULTISPECIES: MGMT family protein [Candidatus Nitrosocaldus]SPC34715.1 putative methylated-DNA--protein-cysteine methyltransferase [Candidatus Nitrosocaldus cavascurensis]
MNMSMDEMSIMVYRLVSMVPEGRVCTYSDLARALGKPKAYRLVGKILNRNPNPVVVPCHRVVRSDGRVGGYMHGYEAKRRLLEGEGIRIDGKGMIVDFDSVRFRLDKINR